MHASQSAPPQYAVVGTGRVIGAWPKDCQDTCALPPAYDVAVALTQGTDLLSLDAGRLAHESVNYK